MNKLQNDTEERILLAAKELFISKGFHAVRMEGISVLAKVNTASLYYYFRSKKNLYETVFETVLLKFISDVNFIWGKNTRPFRNIEKFVSDYVDLLEENPKVPRFILSELARRPDSVNQFLNRLPDLTEGMTTTFNVEFINQVINTLPLCTFPPIFEPEMRLVFFKGETAEYHKYLNESKALIFNILNQSINKQLNNSNYEEKLF